MRGMPLWLFSMRVRQLIVHPENVQQNATRSWPAAIGFGIVMDACDMPGVRLESAIEQLDRDERAAIERNAAKLSVKLLMPTGLCFLPAFVLVGVIPAIASFMM